MLLVAWVDEVQSGGPVLAAADVRSELDISASVLAAALFVVPFALGSLFEAVVLFATDGWNQRRLVAGALVAMALGQLTVAAAPGPISLSLALTAWGIASGISTSGAEAALVAGSDDPDRTLARWTLFGTLGDLLAPALFAATAALGLGWRTALLVGSAVALVDAAAILLGPPLSGEEDEDDDDAPPWRTVLADALRNRGLMAWLLAAACCTLFDEIVLAFSALYLRDAGYSAAEQGIVLGTFPVGATLGIAIVERAGWQARRVLLASAAATTAAWLAWLTLPGLPGTMILGFLFGLSVSPMWALCTARAYATGVRPGVVVAVGRLFVVIDLGAPLFLGIVADQLGVTVALLLLLAQPAVVAIVAARDYRSIQ